MNLFFFILIINYLKSDIKKKITDLFIDFKKFLIKKFPFLINKINLLKTLKNPNLWPNLINLI